jgi:hypothetical protein
MFAMLTMGRLIRFLPWWFVVLSTLVLKSGIFIYWTTLILFRKFKVISHDVADSDRPIVTFISAGVKTTSRKASSRRIQQHKHKQIKNQCIVALFYKFHAWALQTAYVIQLN